MSKHVHIFDVTYIPWFIYLPCLAWQRETLGHAQAPGQSDLHRLRWHSHGRPILCTCTIHFIKLYYYMSLLYTRQLIIHNWTYDANPSIIHLATRGRDPKCFCYFVCKWMASIMHLATGEPVNLYPATRECPAWAIFLKYHGWFRVYYKLKVFSMISLKFKYISKPVMFKCILKC